LASIVNYIYITSYKKKQWRPPSKKNKRAKTLSPRNRKACHSVSTALLNKSVVAEIGTQSAMESGRKTLHRMVKKHDWRGMW
jgi:FixJ family two-component response regulator